MDDQFYSNIIFQTTSKGDVEQIGITDFNITIYKDEDLRVSEQLNFTSPIKYYLYYFTLSNVLQDHNISCIGEANVKFNAGDVVQNEIIHFKMDIIIPKNFVDLRYDKGITLLWVQVFLVFTLIVAIGFIIRIIVRMNREGKITEKDRKRDKQFWDYIGKKAKEQKEP